MQLIWDEFLKILREEAGTQIVETWFKAVSLDRWDKETNTAFLRMPNQFVSKWIEQNYVSLIKTHLSRLLHTDSVKLFFTFKETHKKTSIIPASALQKPFIEYELKKQPPPKAEKKSTALKVQKPGYLSRRKTIESNLNENYTFNSFVVGPTNQLAHAAAVAVSKNLGDVYNPLFIYGSTGLGKTHLLHAIGNEIKKSHPAATVRYETSDNFINEFINSIKGDRIKQFREKFQKIDLLMVDDIQFFSRKEQTQETFFHIFDNLYAHNKQIILSSDTLPREITGLQSRIKSRLQSGLVADIQMPTLEMKMAILKKKAIALQVDINDDVAKAIAREDASSIRELEGMLMRIVALSSITKAPIDRDLTEQILREAPKRDKKHISPEMVIKTVASHTNVATHDIKSKKRTKDVVLARQLALYLIKKTTACSFQSIGTHIGGRNHSTVLHAVTKIESLKKTDRSIEKKITQLENALGL